MLENFIEPTDGQWKPFESRHELKQSCEDETRLLGSTRQLLAEFNSSTIIGFLEELTGVVGLCPDPHFRGGGLHQTERDGFLGIHADFNVDSRLRLDRRLNLLLYLNKDWEEYYGGHLELWNTGMTESVVKVLPVFNRCVIFNTTDTAFHGHPDLDIQPLTPEILDSAFKPREIEPGQDVTELMNRPYDPQPTIAAKYLGSSHTSVRDPLS